MRSRNHRNRAQSSIGACFSIGGAIHSKGNIMTLPPIPETTLRATYARSQPYYRDWPTDYAQGMSNPVIAAIVDMLARRQVPSFGRRRADRQGVKLRALALGEIDRKRAAAGDKDDD
jgi:hypothetical protein